jgi:archaellum component FlaC
MMLSALKVDLQKNIQDNQTMMKDQLTTLFRTIITVVNEGFASRDKVIDEVSAKVDALHAENASLRGVVDDQARAIRSELKSVTDSVAEISARLPIVSEDVAAVSEKLVLVERKLLAEITSVSESSTNTAAAISNELGSLSSTVADQVGVVSGLTDSITNINITVTEIRDSQKFELEAGLSTLSEELKNMPPALNALVENDDIRLLMSELKEACAVRPKKKESTVDATVSAVATSMRVEEVSLKPDAPAKPSVSKPVPKVRESVSKIKISSPTPVSHDDAEDYDDYDGSALVIDSISYESEDELPPPDVLAAAKLRMDEERRKMQADAVTARHGELSSNILLLRAEFEDEQGALRIPMRGFGEKVAGYKAKVAAMKEEYETKFAAWVSEHGKKDITSGN